MGTEPHAIPELNSRYHLVLYNDYKLISSTYVVDPSYLDHMYIAYLRQILEKWIVYIYYIFFAVTEKYEL